MARANVWRAALSAGLLPLLASCWWLESEPGPGEWSLRSGTIGDFQPQHVATLNERDGPGSLLMECGQGAIAMWVRPDRELITGGAELRAQVDGRDRERRGKGSEDQRGVSHARRPMATSPRWPACS